MKWCLYKQVHSTSIVEPVFFTPKYYNLSSNSQAIQTLNKYIMGPCVWQAKADEIITKHNIFMVKINFCKSPERQVLLLCCSKAAA